MMQIQCSNNILNYFQTVQRIVAEMKPEPEVLNLMPSSLEDILKNILEVGVAISEVDASRCDE